jgi:hypothetical protein
VLLAPLLDCIRRPARDAWRGLEAAIPPGGVTALAVVAVSLCASWWIYVPLHELLHALGCWVTGGEVTRLEIDAVYGAALWRRLFPFVAVGSHDYAGRLTGFDTHGNDLVYLATDLAPFALTVLLGVPLLQAVPGSTWRPPVRAIALGVAAPVAFAPFVSLSGDYYEMGSILVSRAVALANPVFDVVKLAATDLPSKGGLAAADIAGLAVGAMVGLTLSFATYALGSRCARWFKRVRLQPSGRGGRTHARPSG